MKEMRSIVMGLSNTHDSERCIEDAFVGVPMALFVAFYLPGPTRLADDVTNECC
jgi:hypothetical protein